MKSKLLSIGLFLLSTVVLLPACAGNKPVGRLFERYAQKDGFVLDKSEPDIHFDFGKDKEIISFVNSVKQVFTLTFDRKSGSEKELNRFEKRLERTLKRAGFKTAMEFKAGGRLAILVKRDKDDNISELVFIKEFGDSYSWVWAPAEKDKNEQSK